MMRSNFFANVEMSKSTQNQVLKGFAIRNQKAMRLGNELECFHEGSCEYAEFDDLGSGTRRKV